MSDPITALLLGLIIGVLLRISWQLAERDKENR